MPEGHTVHRTANAIQRDFARQNLSVSSPQGRFLESAQLLDGAELIRAFAVGKQMFLEFSGERYVRIHLGIYGKWRIEPHGEGGPPQPIGQVRLRLVSRTHYADVRGPTACELQDVEQVRAHIAAAGPDPLAPDESGAAREDFIRRVRASKQSIGLLLMNQSVVSGIGNVYRAELLFRAGQNPHTPGREVSEEVIGAIWDDSVRLLQVGVANGIMITRDELFDKMPKFEDRYFVYKREGQACRVCETHIVLEIAGARKLYWCPGCQG